MIIKMSSTIKSWQHWHITAFTPFDNDTHRTSQWKMSWFICAELMIKQINPLLGLAKITSFFFVCRTFMTTRQVMFMLVAVMMMLLVLAPYMLKGLILESQGLATQLVCHKQDILSRKSFIVWPSVPPLISLWTKLFTKKSTYLAVHSRKMSIIHTFMKICLTITRTCISWSKFLQWFFEMFVSPCNYIVAISSPL